MSVTSKLDTTRIILLVKGNGIFTIITNILFSIYICRIEVLHTWKERSFDISYGSLLEVLVKGNFKDCAIEMVAVLSED